MIRRPPRSTQSRSSAASDVYKRQVEDPAITTTALLEAAPVEVEMLEDARMILVVVDWTTATTEATGMEVDDTATTGIGATTTGEDRAAEDDAGIEAATGDEEEEGTGTGAMAGTIGNVLVVVAAAATLERAVEAGAAVEAAGAAAAAATPPMVGSTALGSTCHEPAWYVGQARGVTVGV